MKKFYFPIIYLFWTNSLFAQEFTIQNNQLSLPAPIIFETGNDNIKVESDAVIIHIKKFLDTKSYVSTLRIEVHTDNSAAEAFNQSLSEKRALAIAKRLVKEGVDCKKLIAVGFGSTKPIAENKTPEGKSQNRRTEIHIAALRGRLVGGMPADGGGKVAGDACQ